jgi:ABC-type amino acid transport substrate-binding protein
VIARGPARLALATAFAFGVVAASAQSTAPAPAEQGGATEGVGADWESVRIGVRVDAMPFAWRDLKPEREGAADGDAKPHLVFRGFLVDLCKTAAIHARFRPEMVEVTADRRREFLRGLEPVGSGWPPAGEDGGRTAEDPGFDLLCDPTTLSLSRMYLMSEDERFVFSPIVFVANSSFVTPNPVALEEARKAGKWAARPAAADEASPVDSEAVDEPPVAPADAAGKDECYPGGSPTGPTFVAGYVTGTTARDAVTAAVDLGRFARPAKEYCARSFPSHRDGMTAICSGAINYYFGDIDIIAAYEKEIDALPGKSCDLEYTRDFLIYEPYAVLVGEGKNGFRQKFVRELYRLFSDGTVQDVFDAYFPDRRSSAALDMLFRINGVPFGSLPALGGEKDATGSGETEFPGAAEPAARRPDPTSGRQAKALSTP